MKYTYDKLALAHTSTGNGVVIVPDQVSDDQYAYDGKTFPAIRSDFCGRRGGEKIRVRLDGDKYGLGTSGTGDMIVAIV